MNDTVNLTIKIDPELKETLKNLALENQVSMSQEICQRLQLSLSQQRPEIDSSHTEEHETPQLTDGELKQIRSLLKKSKKRKV